MKLSTARTAFLLGTMALAPALHATSTLDDSLSACVQAVASETGARHLHVVRQVDLFGRGNTEYWLNAAADRGIEPAQKSYCKTRSDRVSLIESAPGRWTRTTASRPADSN